jgi:hypothetical protein
VHWQLKPERRHGSTRVPGHAFPAWRSSWWMVVYIYKGKRYGRSITYKITPAGSLSSSQPIGPPCWASSLAFGLVGLNFRLSSRLLYILSSSPLSTFPTFFFCIFFWRARVCRPLLRVCRPFMIFEGCLDSNPECCRSKLARYRLSHPSLYLATHPST